MRKINLLYTMSEFMYGSKTRQLIDLLQGLDKDIFNIEVGSIDIGDEATNEVLSLCTNIKEIRVNPPRNISLNKIIKFAKSPAMLNNNYDIIHSLHYSSLIFEPLFVKLFTNAKYIFTKTNLQWDNHKLNWMLKSKLSDRIISISSDVSELMTNKGYVNKITQIPLGIDTNYFIPSTCDKVSYIRDKYNVPNNVTVFGCAAQFIKSKKHDALLAGIKNLIDMQYDIYLVMCGQSYNDNYFNQVNELIKYYGLAHKVKYLGTLSDMREFYGLIDYFVLPSTNEAFGIVYIEAMSSGLPVIGCFGGGAEDIIDDSVNGFLVQSNDIDGLTNVMKTYLDYSELKYSHGQAGREHVKRKFSKDVMVKSHEKLYIQIANLNR